MEDRNVDVVGGSQEEIFQTDVENVCADGYIQQGTNKFPKFKVTRDEFWQNQMDGRKRLRFRSGTPAQQYLSGTKYRIPFYISYQEEDGKIYTRKVK
jgi:hypothetical protein